MARRDHGRRRFLRRGLAALAAGVAATGAGCGGGPGTVTVGMDDLSFDPETARVDAGGTVRWENGSDVGHTVTAYADELPDGAAYFASGGFASERAARDDVAGGLIPPDESYEYTFERAGEYGYYCIPHEGAGMVGTVRVG